MCQPSAGPGSQDDCCRSALAGKRGFVFETDKLKTHDNPVEKMVETFWGLSGNENRVGRGAANYTAWAALFPNVTYWASPFLLAREVSQSDQRK